jgi:hypothetical protein
MTAHTPVRHVYTLEGGRSILRDGVPAMNITLKHDPCKGYAIPPDECDDFARDVVKWANVSPDLVEALRELVSRCDGEAGVRVDGSNIETAQAHAALTQALGEGWTYAR